MTGDLVPWVAALVRRCNDAALVLDPCNRKVLWSDSMKTGGCRLEQPELFAELVGLADHVRRDGLGDRRASIIRGALRCSVEVWHLAGDHVLLVIQPAPRWDSVAGRLSAATGLEPADARLALKVARGLSNREIASQSGLAEGTVKTRVYRLYRRLAVRNRAELAREVGRVVDPEDVNAHSY